jgi:hypothetical protein
MTLQGMAKPHRAIRINLTFVDKDLKVFDQMQTTIAAPRTMLAGERDHATAKLPIPIH